MRNIRLPVPVRLVMRIHIVSLVVAFFVNDDHTTSVLLHSSVVRSRENGSEACVSEIFDTCLYSLVSSENSCKIRLSQESAYSVWAKLLDGSLEAISHAWSDAIFI